jgi:hypothetical protein
MHMYKILNFNRIPTMMNGKDSLPPPPKAGKKDVGWGGGGGPPRLSFPFIMVGILLKFNILYMCIYE